MIYLGHGKLELNEGVFKYDVIIQGGPPNLTSSDKGGGGV